MKVKINTLTLILLLSIVALSGSVAAQETAPSTGHTYEFVEAENITWEEAREAAAERTYNGKQGYLVTITSEEEQEFIESMDTTGRIWIGATDSAEEGTWRWVTGPEGQEDGGQGRHFFTQTGDEGGNPVDDNYENWGVGEYHTEPNNHNDGEDYAQLKGDKTWNDIDNSGKYVGGYIVEYGGLDEQRDVRTSSATGHQYEFIKDEDITWEEAREAAAERTYNGKQGYLVTITSEQEQEFIESMNTTGREWIGATDSAEEGTWRWVTGPEGQEDGGQGRHFFTQTGDEGGNPVDGNYENWAVGEYHTEPNNHNGGEDYAQLKGDKTWNDIDNSGKYVGGYIVEYGGLGTQSEQESTTASEPEQESTTAIGVDPSFTFEPSPPTVEQQVAFSAGDTNTQSSDIISYNWKFGDGETATGKTVTHTYSEAGGYNVKLTVITNQGESKTTTQPVSVEQTESNDDGSVSVEAPGFGILSVILGLIGSSYLFIRKQNSFK